MPAAEERNSTQHAVPPRRPSLAWLSQPATNCLAEHLQARWGARGGQCGGPGRHGRPLLYEGQLWLAFQEKLLYGVSARSWRHQAAAAWSRSVPLGVRAWRGVRQAILQAQPAPPPSKRASAAASRKASSIVEFAGVSTSDLT